MRNKNTIFSKRIEREQYMMTKSFFYVYMTPLILPIIFMLVDGVLGTKGFLLLSTASVTFYLSIKYLTKETERINRTYQWEKSEAIVLRKSIAQLSALCTKIGVPYRVKIKYKYIYQDTEYISDVFALSMFNVEGCNHLFSSEAEAKQYIDKHFQNNKATIYVNPDKPEQSVVRRGLSRTEKPSYFLLIVNYQFVTIIFFLMFFGS